jgi:hypothetical protein
VEFRSLDLATLAGLSGERDSKGHELEWQRSDEEGEARGALPGSMV